MTIGTQKTLAPVASKTLKRGPDQQSFLWIGIEIEWKCRLAEFSFVRSMQILTIVASQLAFHVVGTLAVLGQDAQLNSKLRSAMDESVRELVSPTLLNRTRAERQLQELGPEILPFLPPPERMANAAAREAVKRIRKKLEQQVAKTSALPSRITLRGEMSVTDLLSQIERQTQNRVDLSDGATERGGEVLKIEFQHRPFWECLDHICDRLQLSFEADLQKPLLRLTAGRFKQSSDLSVQYVGPFRIALHSVAFRSVIGTTDRQLLRVSAKIFVEPRLRPLFLQYSAADMKASLEADPLIAWNTEAKYEHSLSDAGREIPVQFDYLLPTTREKSHENGVVKFSLAGRMTLQLAAATERIVFDTRSLTAGVSRRRGGVSVRLRHAKFELQTDGVPKAAESMTATIGVVVGYDQGGPAFESHRTWMLHNVVFLENELGERIWFTDYDTTQQSGGAVAVDYRWSKLSRPASQYKFIYEAPTLILDAAIDLNFSEIRIEGQRHLGD